MRGVVLAGGTGSRMHPLTKATNKHLLPVLGKPMIYHAIGGLVAAGITDIMVVTGKEHAGSVISCLGSGVDLGADLVYGVQDRAGGIAEALGLAKSFSNGEPLVVVLGDNIFEDDMYRLVSAYPGKGALIALKSVTDPRRYGVALVDGSGRVVQIEEKPEKPKSTFAVTGFYIYDSTVFNIIDGLSPSRRGELEITDVNNAYISRGTMKSCVLRGRWSDAGTLESYKKVNAWHTLDKKETE